jgi:diguanylate cyclase (GGDEF)-like protein
MNHDQKNPLSRRFDVRFMTTLGFTLVIGVLLIAVVGSYHTTSRHNQALAGLMHAADRKASLAFTMRDTLRQRIESLQTMLFLNTRSDREAEKLRYLSLNAEFSRAHSKLLDQLQSSDERASLRSLDDAMQSVGPIHHWALTALFNNDLEQAPIKQAVRASVSGYESLIGRVDDLLRAMQQGTQQRIHDATAAFNRTFWMTAALVVVAFIIALFTAVAVVINTGKRSRQLTHQAAHDGLTGLLNRQAFEAALRLALEESSFAQEHHALLLLDLDRFKVVNDTCGHPAGDALLKALSAHVAERLRHSDVFARMGGDEFGVLLRYTEPSDAERVAEKLREAIEDYTFHWQGQSFRVGASIGMVAFGHRTSTVQELLSAADACCYSAKEEGRNRVHHREIDDVMIQRRGGEMRWISKITDAIEHDRFVLYGQIIKPLQPKADDGRLMVEVLLRMVDKDGGGLIPPGQFLPVAERYGIVPDIDRWVVAHALGWLSSLGGHAQQIRMNVNISGPAASDPQFHDHVRTCIDAHRVPAESICLEITESDAVRSLANAAALIEGLGDLGCRFALDDFGSGMSVP